MNVVFRIDAGVSNGLGYAMRCLTLANYWKMLGFNCQFYSLLPSPASKELLRDFYLEDVSLHGEQHWKTVKANVYVVDSYEVTVHRDEVDAFLIHLDDWPHRNIYPELLVDQNLGRKAQDYENLTDSQCRVAAGSKYLILREEFYKKAVKSRDFQKSDLKVLINLGGSDVHGYSFKIAKHLLKKYSHQISAITVLVSKNSPSWDNLKELPVGRISYCNDMPNLYSEYDVCFGAAGSSSWERAISGLPSAVYIMSENQKEVATACENYRIAKTVGSFTTGPMHDDDIIDEFFKKRNFLESMAIKGRKLFRRRGVVEITKELIKTDLFSVKLCNMKTKDVRWIYELQCRPGMRKYFNNKLVPTWCEHTRWFRAYLSDKKNKGYVVSLYGNVVGFIRIDGELDREVSIVISKEYQGLGIGKIALNLLASREFNKIRFSQVIATIKDANKSSIKLFKSCGFKRVSGEKYAWSN